MGAVQAVGNTNGRQEIRIFYVPQNPNQNRNRFDNYQPDNQSSDSDEQPKRFQENSDQDQLSVDDDEQQQSQRESENDEENEQQSQDEDDDENNDFHNLFLFQLHLKMLTDKLELLMAMEAKRHQDQEKEKLCPKAIQICYHGQQKSQCQSQQKKESFLHKRCYEKAWFFSDCQIKCEGNCPQFSIKEALFDCSSGYIIDSNQFISLRDRGQLEKISNLMQLSEFIKSSLDISNYSTTQQLNFQKQVYDSPCFQQIMLQ